MSAALRAYAQRQAAEAAANDAGGLDQSAGGAGSSEDAGEVEAPPLVGKKVVISGLLARPDLNGLVGEATSFDASKGRYAVLINAEVLSLKPANLAMQKSNENDATAFAPSARVRIKGLVAKPELNECGGTVVEWNADKERYIVALDGSLKTMLLRAQNLERDRRERCMCARARTLNPVCHAARRCEKEAAPRRLIVLEPMLDMLQLWSSLQGNPRCRRRRI